MNSLSKTQTRLASGCALLLLAAVTVAAPAAPVQPPPLGKPRPLQLPPISEQTLPNGLKLVVLEDHRAPALWVRLALPAGTSRDPRDKIGLADLTAGLLDHGTEKRSEAQIADLVDGLGLSLGAAADEDFITISGSGLTSHAATLFYLLGDITLHPTFPEVELNKVRTRTLNSVMVSLNQPDVIADAALTRLLYGAHPYGNFSAGTPATLGAITRADLVAFHDLNFASNKATLFVTGDITPRRARALAQGVFGAWPGLGSGDITAPEAPVAADGPHLVVIDRPGAAQTEIRIGALAGPYRDPHRFEGTLATAVLGLGQFEGRLTREIRVKRGLTYGAASYFSRHADAGTFEISTYTKNASTGEVVRLALGEAEKLRHELVPADELAARKSFILGSFAVSVATPQGVLRRLVPAVLLGDGPSDLSKYTARVEAVTPAQIEDVMNKVQARPLNIVLVGDASAIADQLKPLGTFTTIPFKAVDLRSPTLIAPAAVPAQP